MIIYQIKNLITNKCYIGQTTQSLHDRIRGHFKRTDTYIGRALRKYGKESFEFTVLIECKSLEQMNNLEWYYIKMFNTLEPNGYNIKSGGNNVKMTDFIKKKLSDSHKGKKLTENQRKALLPFAGSGKKSIICMNIKSNEIIIFKSINEACRNLKIDQSTIQDSLKNRVKNPRKYKFEYLKG